MICQGELETRRDATLERKTISVNVALDIADMSIELDGYWGCLADMGNISAKPQEYRCLGRQPVRIGEGEATYSSESDSDSYFGQTNLVLNRYSATLTVNSFALAKPQAKATWTTISVSGRLQCTSQDKKF